VLACVLGSVLVRIRPERWLAVDFAKQFNQSRSTRALALYRNGGDPLDNLDGNRAGDMHITRAQTAAIFAGARGAKHSGARPPNLAGRDRDRVSRPQRSLRGRRRPSVVAVSTWRREHGHGAERRTRGGHGGFARHRGSAGTGLRRGGSPRQAETLGGGRRGDRCDYGNRRRMRTKPGETSLKAPTISSPCSRIAVLTMSAFRSGERPASRMRTTPDETRCRRNTVPRSLCPR